MKIYNKVFSVISSTKGLNKDHLKTFVLLFAMSCSVQFLLGQNEQWIEFGLSTENGLNGDVESLVTNGTDVYAGGQFTVSGGVATIFVSKWDGTSWSALGGGLGNDVYSLATDGTNLYAGGKFTATGGAGGITANRIAKWDGSSWSALGSGLDNDVNAVVVIGADVYAGGSFLNAGGAAANRIAKWDGTTWSALGSGLNGIVRTMEVVGTDLYVSGSFTDAGGVSVNQIAKWDGSSWTALGGGLATGYAHDLLADGTDLYVCGDFQTVDGTLSANRIAIWDGSTWSAPMSNPSPMTPFNGTVTCLAFANGDLYAGGGFSAIPFDGMANPGEQSINISRFDGSEWLPMGDHIGAYPEVMLTVGDKVFIGGGFTTAGGKVSWKIAKWNTLTGGSCFNGTITLNSQSDIDDFQTNYGLCDSIVPGSKLIIDDTAGDITDLTPLSNLKYVSWLEIYDTDLTSLAGLENLSQATMAKCVMINNPLLTDISQLAGVQPSMGDLAIIDSPALIDLTGIDNLTALGTTLSLRNLGITNLNALSNLDRVDRFFYLTDNASLTDISGLSNMTDFGAGQNGYFAITDNASLSDCSPICSLVKNTLPLRPSNTIDIQNNLGACLDEATLVASCPKSPCNQNDITLNSQAQVNSFQQTYGPCDSIVGTLQIGASATPNTDITDLSGLSSIESTKSLLIFKNEALTSLDGLENITQASMSVLRMNGNKTLTDISQLSGIGPDVTKFIMTNNDAIVSLKGLENITNFTELNLNNNDKIAHLNDLNPVSVGRTLWIRNNNSLFDISSLAGITSYGTKPNAKFTLDQNDFLQDCSPICSIFSQLDGLTNPQIIIGDNLGECLDAAALSESCCSHPDLAALTALYNTLDGPNWNQFAGTDWLSNCDPCGVSTGTAWAGITCANNRVIYISSGGGMTNVSGVLPDELGDLDSLELIDFFNESISGSIPESICNLQKLNNINFGFNDLSGRIPACLELTEVQNVNLSDNNLTGPLPKLSNSTNFPVTLSFQNNNFTGTLPRYDLINNLEVLQLNNNNLIGSWPQAWNRLCAVLAVRNFNDNNYDGVNDFISLQGWLDFCNSNTGASNCSDNYIEIRDVNFEQALIDLGVDSEGTLDGCVLISDVEVVTELNLRNSNISDLTGIEAFTDLERLLLEGNVLPPINLADNVKLEYLEVDNCEANTYSFNYLTPGNLNGQDNWISKGWLGDTPAAYTTDVGTVQNGSQGIVALSAGANVGTSGSRIENENWQMPDIESDDTAAYFEFEAKISLFGVMIGPGYDTDNDGEIDIFRGANQETPLFFWLSSASSPTWGLKIVPSGGYGAATTVPVSVIGAFGDHVKIKVEIDFEANGGAGSASAFYQNITNGDTGYQPITGLQNVALALDFNAADHNNPSLWHGFTYHFEGPGEIDNITFSNCQYEGP